MDAENLGELEAMFRSGGKGWRVVVHLEDLTLVDRDAVRFLVRCDTDSITPRNCPAYIREWIARERLDIDSSSGKGRNDERPFQQVVEVDAVPPFCFGATTAKDTSWPQQLIYGTEGV